ncbi:MAG: hypothetical protein FJW24_11710 [Acidimicrobiia bacterium]|nr:hypothetical protein [Acidimicrobiia bacterium]
MLGLKAEADATAGKGAQANTKTSGGAAVAAVKLPGEHLAGDVEPWDFIGGEVAGLRVKPVEQLRFSSANLREEVRWAAPCGRDGKAIAVAPDAQPS